MRRVLCRPKAPVRFCDFLPVFFLPALKVRLRACPISTRPLTCGAVRRGSPSCRSLSVLYLRLISRSRVTAGSDPGCGVPASTRGTLSSRCSSFRGVRKQCSSFRAVRIFAPVRRRSLPPPHAALGAYRRAAQKARQENRKDKGCLRSAKGSPAALVQALGRIRPPCDGQTEERKTG